MLLSHNRNEALTRTTTWMNLADVKLGERSRHRRQLLSDSTHRRSLEESDPQRQEVDGGARDWGRGQGVSVSQGQSLNLGR